MDDMIEIGGTLLPATYEKAVEIAKAKEAIIEEARKRIHEAEEDFIKVCMEQYPVGIRVDVNIAARRSPTHRVVSVSPWGMMKLQNVCTGTIRELRASSSLISPSRAWYERTESAKKKK